MKNTPEKRIRCCGAAGLIIAVLSASGSLAEDAQDESPRLAVVAVASPPDETEGGDRTQSRKAGWQITPPGFRPFVLPRPSEMEKLYDVQALPRDLYTKLVAYDEKCSDVMNRLRPSFFLIGKGRRDLSSQIAKDVQEFVDHCRDRLRDANEPWQNWKAGTLRPLNDTSRWLPMVTARMVVLRRLDLGEYPFCSGILIDGRNVLTASHCVHDSERRGQRVSKEQLEVAAYMQPLRWIKVINFRVGHTGTYDKHKEPWDFALLELAEQAHDGLQPLASFWDGHSSLPFDRALLIPAFDPFAFAAWKISPRNDALSAAAKEGDWSAFVFVDSSYYCRSGEPEPAAPLSCVRHSCVVANGGSGAGVFLLGDKKDEGAQLIGVHHGARETGGQCKDDAPVDPHLDAWPKFQAQPNRAVLVPNNFIASTGG